MTPIFYDSYQRFTNRIEKYWIKNGIRYNLGNLQLLKYAWRTKLLYANINHLKRSKINIIDTQQIKLKI